MTEQQAIDMAEALGGSVWQNGDQDGDYMVVVRRQDGKLVMMSDEVMCEFDNGTAMPPDAVVGER
ncbi:MAG: hypothetical protein GC159_18370 [Phycisphaera sp.]|nr:hypothetical protein [Phycisphaera sp.]